RSGAGDHRGDPQRRVRFSKRFKAAALLSGADLAGTGRPASDSAFLPADLFWRDAALEFGDCAIGPPRLETASCVNDSRARVCSISVRSLSGEIAVRWTSPRIRILRHRPRYRFDSEADRSACGRNPLSDPYAHGRLSY